MTAPTDSRVTPSVVGKASAAFGKSLLEAKAGDVWPYVLTAALAQIDAARPSRTYSDEEIEAAERARDPGVWIQLDDAEIANPEAVAQLKALRIAAGRRALSVLDGRGE